MKKQLEQIQSMVQTVMEQDPSAVVVVSISCQQHNIGLVNGRTFEIAADLAYMMHKADDLHRAFSAAIEAFEIVPFKES